MKLASSPLLTLQRISVISWLMVAILICAGVVVSLPGYFRYFFWQPVNSHFTVPQLFFAFSSGIASLFCALTSVILAIVLFVQKPADRTALFASYFLLFYGVIIGGPLEMIESQIFHRLGILSVHLQVILFTAPFSILLLIFPNGTIVPARFRWIIPCIIPASIIIGLLPADEINSPTTFRSQLIYYIIGILLILSTAAQIYRYVRKSNPVERQQMKIVVFGIFIMFVVMSIDGVIYFQLPKNSNESLSPNYLYLNALWWLSLSIFPISFTLAIFRSHLWDIDIIIRRTLYYSVLTVTLAFIYFASVILIQQVFHLITGEGSPIAVVISTLTIAALFTPLRNRIQSLIDQRFFRQKYNADQAIASFSATARTEMTLDPIVGALIHNIEETMHPEEISLWLVSTAKKK